MIAFTYEFELFLEVQSHSGTFAYGVYHEDLFISSTRNYCSIEAGIIEEKGLVPF